MPLIHDTVGCTHHIPPPLSALNCPCVCTCRSSTGNCPCPCNYATDPTCTCRDLQQPLNLGLTKTPVMGSYPLQYLQSFNYKPYEIIIRPSDLKCYVGALIILFILNLNS